MARSPGTGKPAGVAPAEPLAYTPGEGSVGRARYVAALVVALVLSGGPGAIDHTPPAAAAPLRTVAAAGVSARVPSDWEVQPIDGDAAFLRGIQASTNLDRWSAGRGGGQGIRAYWVDATQIRLPSDYYVLAARGPAMDSLPGEDRCRSEDNHVFLGQGHSHEDWPTGYLATARGTCDTANGDTRWAAFVAAPGFSELRSMGIPQSGMYFAIAAVPRGPGDDRILDRMLAGVSFGETQVSEFLQAAKARMI